MGVITALGIIQLNAPSTHPTPSLWHFLSSFFSLYSMQGAGEAAGLEGVREQSGRVCCDPVIWLAVQLLE